MSLITVAMPKTGADMEEGRIVTWRKKEGDRVEKGEILLEIETDKVNMEIESPAPGVLLKRFYQEGEVAPVSKLICVLGEGNESPEDVMRLAEDRPQPESQFARPAAAAQCESLLVGSAEEPARTIKASPAARRLAKERGLNLATVQGSGPSGRIEKEDVERAAAASAQTRPAPADTLVPLSSMRRAIARRTAQSKREAPDFSVTMAVDMTAALRKKEELQAAGKRVSINDLIISCVSRVLGSHPDLNAEFGGDSIRHHSEAHIGFAVGTDDGLYIPVVRSAQKLSLEEVAAETQRLSSKAEAKQLTEEDMAGGTFTVSNLGIFGVESFTAILNPPQTGILSVGCVSERAVRPDDGGLAWRAMMQATLTVDHRAVDGLAAARFLRDLKNTLEISISSM